MAMMQSAHVPHKTEIQHLHENSVLCRQLYIAFKKQSIMFAEYSNQLRTLILLSYCDTAPPIQFSELILSDNLLCTAYAAQPLFFTPMLNYALL